jgi:hypothetical protein
MLTPYSVPPRRLAPAVQHRFAGHIDIYHHGAEPISRRHNFFSHSRTSQYCVQPAGSLPCSQEPSTVPYHEPDQSVPYHILSKIRLNMRSSTSRSSKCPLSFWLSRQCPVCSPLFPIHATYAAHLILLDLIILVTLDEEYTFLSGSFFRLGPNTVLGAMF